MRERVLEFFPVMERLGQVVQPRAAHDWLFTPNRMLDYDKPAERIRKGDFRSVLAVVDALGEGVFV
jgi:uncharacterized protein (DUF2384 family)